MFFEQLPGSLDAGGDVLKRCIRTDTLRMQEHPQGFGKDDLIFKMARWILSIIIHAPLVAVRYQSPVRAVMLARSSARLRSSCRFCAFVPRTELRLRCAAAGDGDAVALPVRAAAV